MHTKPTSCVINLGCCWSHEHTHACMRAKAYVDNSVCHTSPAVTGVRMIAARLGARPAMPGFASCCSCTASMLGAAALGVSMRGRLATLQPHSHTAVQAACGALLCNQQLAVGAGIAGKTILWIIELRAHGQARKLRSQNPAAAYGQQKPLHADRRAMQ